MDVQQVGNATVVKIIERVDSLTCREVETILQGIIAANPRLLICDFAANKYISSAGLGVFLSTAKSLKRTGGQLGFVCAKTSYVFEVFETAGFTHIIPVFETVDDAIAKLAQVPPDEAASHCPPGNQT
jgi:anti-anti-sigma factor